MIIILCSSTFVVVLYLNQLFAYVCMYMGQCPAKSLLLRSIVPTSTNFFGLAYYYLVTVVIRYLLCR